VLSLRHRTGRPVADTEDQAQQSCAAVLTDNYDIGVVRLSDESYSSAPADMWPCLG